MPEPTAPTRDAAIDALKAAAIVTVVWIHTFPGNVPPQPLVRDLQFLTRFAVPGLFFASGMLAGRTGPRPWRRYAGQRLPRIVVPYLIASVLALWYRTAVKGLPFAVDDALVRLLGGDAFGPFYFVPVLVGGTLALELLGRAPALLGPASALFVATGIACETLVLALEWRTSAAFYWAYRNPLRWWGFLFAGAWVGRRWTHLERAPRWLGPACLAVTAALYVAWAYFGQLESFRARTVAQWIGLWGSIFGIVLIAARQPASRVIRAVADLSYPIYLYHLFVVYQAWETFHRTPRRSLAVWVAGVTIPLVIGLAARRVLGDRARYVTG